MHYDDQNRPMLNEQKEYLLVLGLSIRLNDHHDKVLEEHLKNSLGYCFQYHSYHRMVAIVQANLPL